MTTQQKVTLPPQTERLRSSCNACGTAKVKCDRGQPQCRRCAAMNLICVYGASRKTGKPPRKRLAYGKCTPTAMLTEKNDTPGTRTLRPKSPDYLGPPSSVQLSDLIMTDSPMPPAITFDGIDDHNSLETPFFIPQCSSLSRENWDDLGLDLNLSPAASAVSAPEPNQGFCPATPSVSAKHDCPQESHEVFNDLTAAPSLSRVNADTILSQLDQVLQANRTAIDRLTGLLECSCPRPPYLVMLQSSIISRILGLYQQAAGCAHTVPSGPAAPAPTTSMGNSPPSSSSTPASATTLSTSNAKTYTSGISDEVTQLPFSLGKFNIEEPCVQLAFKNLLIGNELKRAGSLIDLFASQSPADGVEGLYSNLSAWLRAEHSSTVRILRSAIRDLNEGIDL